MNEIKEILNPITDKNKTHEFKEKKDAYFFNNEDDVIKEGGRLDMSSLEFREKRKRGFYRTTVINNLL